MQDKYEERDAKAFIVIKDGRIISLTNTWEIALRVARYNNAAIYANNNVVAPKLVKNYAEERERKDILKEVMRRPAVKVDPKHMPKAARDLPPDEPTEEEVERAKELLQDVADGWDPSQDLEYARLKHKIETWNKYQEEHQ